MNATQQRISPNRIERAGYAILDRLGIHYERQHVIAGKFCVDAFVPEAGVVVQFDGDYWHGHPHKFPKPDTRQRRRMNLDKSQDAYMRACGLTVIRIWESDLRSNADAVMERLRPFVARPRRKPARPA